jgi:hypothetical protein
MTMNIRKPGRVWLIITLIISAGLLASMYYLKQYRFPPLTGRTPAGHAFGAIAFLLILISTFYSVRKARPGWNFGSLETWLRIHMYLGGLSLVFAFAHTGGQFNAQLAVTTFVLLALVVASGAVGYIIYLKIPFHLAEAEREVVIPEELTERLLELKEEIFNFCTESGDTFLSIYEKIVVPLYEKGPIEKPHIPSLASVAGDVRESDQEAFTMLQAEIEECARLFSELALHFRYLRRLKLWLVFHVPLTVAMFVFLIAHIVTVSLY